MGSQRLCPAAVSCGAVYVRVIAAGRRLDKRMMAECKRGVRVRPDPISGRVVAGMRLREPKNTRRGRAADASFKYPHERERAIFPFLLIPAPLHASS